jgi:hypothetical protein
MSETSKKKSGCLKLGCLSCLGLFLLSALLVSAFVMVGPPPQRPIHQTPEHALAAGKGRVHIHVEEARFSIRPGPVGSPLRLDARFDAAGFALTESFEAAEQGGWEYSLDFRSTVFPLRRLLAEDSDDNNVIVLSVPRGTELVISGAVSKGQSALEFGGLDLEAVDLNLGMGQHEVSFGEKTARPLTALRLEGGMGQLLVNQLGNASPVETEVDWAMGKVILGLDGDWAGLSEVFFKSSMGQLEVSAPKGLEVTRGSLEIGLAGETRLPPGWGDQALAGSPASEGVETGAVDLATEGPTAGREVRLHVQTSMGEFYFHQD